jgi:hypothetical protein
MSRELSVDDETLRLSECDLCLHARAVLRKKQPP